MSILIENAESLEYLTDTGRWTKKIGDGKSFKTGRAAFAVAKLEPIGSFNIIRYFPGTHQTINLDHGSGQGKAGH